MPQNMKDPQDQSIVQVLRDFEGKQLVELTYHGRRCWLLQQVEEVMTYAPQSLASQVAGVWAGEFRTPEDVEVIRGAPLRALKKLLHAVESHSIASKTSQIALVYESGLNRIAILSNKPIGIRLRDKLCREVMPEIAATGAYIPAGHPSQALDTAALGAEIGKAMRDALEPLRMGLAAINRRVGALEVGGAGAVYGAARAEDEILAPVRRWARCMAECEPGDRKARDAAYRRYHGEAIEELRSRTRYHGTGHDWEFLPRAERPTVKVCLRVLDRRLHKTLRRLSREERARVRALHEGAQLKLLTPAGRPSLAVKASQKRRGA